MSITWGRRPVLEPRASLAQRIALVLCVVIAAASASPAESSVLRPPELIGPETQATIQGLFDLHRAAIERRDRVSYELTLDPRSKDFVACMGRLFDLGRARADALAPGQVVGLEPVAGTNLVRVRLQQRDGIGIHYVRRFLIGPVTAFPWLDIKRSVPAWYISRPDPGDPGSSSLRAGECVEEVALRGVIREEDRALASGVAHGSDLLA